MTVIATAGHVDQGKSTFVNFLTKQETDRLPDEKKRGLTINVGYTYFTIEDKTYSIVDVPGHKDFYKNTISGFANADVILFSRFSYFIEIIFHKGISISFLDTYLLVVS